MKKLAALLVLAMLLCGTALAETVSPMSSFDMDALTDCMPSVGFTMDDVTESGIKVTVYCEEIYDIADVWKLSLGDTLATGDGDVVIDSLAYDDGDILVNGGMDEGGVTLRAADEDNCFYRVEYELAAMLPLGEAQLSFADEVKLNVYKMADDLSPDGEGYDVTALTAQNVRSALQDLSDKLGSEFTPYQASVLIEGGVITEITIDYVS